MAEDILNKLVVEHNFDMAYSEDAELGHAFSIPFEYLIGKRNIPVIPFFTNVYVPPLPTPRRCEALGKAIAADRQGPQGARGDRRQRRHVALPRHARSTLSPEFDFDRWLVSQMEAGNTDALLNMTGTQLDEVGNTEMLNWAVMFGAIGRSEGELIDYIPTWHHGLGDDALPATARAQARADEGRRAVRRLPVQEPGLQFYKHPPAEAYGLNKLLFESRHSQPTARPHHRRLRERGERVRAAGTAARRPRER